MRLPTRLGGTPANAPAALGKSGFTQLGRAHPDSEPAEVQQKRISARHTFRLAAGSCCFTFVLGVTLIVLGLRSLCNSSPEAMTRCSSVSGVVWLPERNTSQPFNGDGTKEGGCAHFVSKGDAFCDGANNVESCDWDGGDCCESTGGVARPPPFQLDCLSPVANDTDNVVTLQLTVLYAHYILHSGSFKTALRGDVAAALSVPARAVQIQSVRPGRALLVELALVSNVDPLRTTLQLAKALGSAAASATLNLSSAAAVVGSAGVPFKPSFAGAGIGGGGSGSDDRDNASQYAEDAAAQSLARSYSWSLGVTVLATTADTATLLCPGQSRTCPQQWVADGYCDARCDCDVFRNDGGDCAGRCSSACPPNWLGDNFCDAGCNNADCGFDCDPTDPTRCDCGPAPTPSGPIACAAPPAVGSGTVVFVGGNLAGSAYSVGKEVRYTCNTGYLMHHGWSTPATAAGSRAGSTSGSRSSSIFVSAIGHEHASVCQPSGTWSAPPGAAGAIAAAGFGFDCREVVCPVPALVSDSGEPCNCNATGSSYSFQSIVSYTCRPGFEHSSGAMMRVCGADGTWIGAAPHCVRIAAAAQSPAVTPAVLQCPPLPAIAHQAVWSVRPDPWSRKPNSVAAFACAHGYKRDGRRHQLQLFTFHEAVDEGPPTLHFRCKAPAGGASPSSPPRWTPVSTAGAAHGIHMWPSCVIQTCPFPSQPAHSGATVSTLRIVSNSMNSTVAESEVPDGHSPYGAALQYSCSTGYHHVSGSLTRSCQADGTWDTAAPVCTASRSGRGAACPSECPAKWIGDNWCDAACAIPACKCDGGDCVPGSDARFQAEHACVMPPPATPPAAPVDCADPPPVDNAAKSVVSASSTGSGTGVGATVSYTCASPGFLYAGGSSVRTCTDGGTWSGTTPICVSARPTITVPNSPVVTSVTVAGPGWIRVFFVPGASDGGTPVSFFRATASPGGLTGTLTEDDIISAAVSSPSSSLSIDVKGLTNGQAYAFTVVATNSKGDSVSHFAKADRDELTAAEIKVEYLKQSVQEALDDEEKKAADLAKKAAGEPTAANELSQAEDELEAVREGQAAAALARATIPVAPYTTPPSPILFNSAPYRTPGQLAVTFAPDAAGEMDCGSPVTSYTMWAQTLEGGNTGVSRSVVLESAPEASYTLIFKSGGDCATQGGCLSNGVSYKFAALASNAGGNSLAPHPVTGQATMVDAPSAPRSVSAALVNSSSAYVTFATPLSNGGAAIHHYDVSATTHQTACRGGEDEPVLASMEVTGGVREASVIDLEEHFHQAETIAFCKEHAPGSESCYRISPCTYRFRVRAHNTLNYSGPWSSSISQIITKSEVLVPAAPIMGTPSIAGAAANTGGTVIVLFNSAERATSYRATVYQSEYSVTSGQKLDSSPITHDLHNAMHTMAQAQSWCDSAAACWGFSFSFSADNHNGLHGCSSACNVYYKTASAPPWGSSARTEPRMSSNADWVVYQRTVSSASASGQTNSQKTSNGFHQIVVTGLTNGLTYAFTTTASNAAGDGPESLMSSAIQPVGPPLQPVIIHVSSGSHLLVVHFSANANDGGSPVTNFKVTATPSTASPSHAAKTVVGVESPLSVDGLLNSVAYTVSVVTANAQGVSAPALSALGAHEPVEGSACPSFTCNPALRGDGWCDSSCNVAACSFDDGDCCVDSNAHPGAGSFTVSSTGAAALVSSKPFDCVDPMYAEDNVFSIRANFPSCAGPVRHQGSCGQGWSHAATTSFNYGLCMDGIATPHSHHLSPQQLGSCWAETGLESGCNGGITAAAVELAFTSGYGRESCFPYKGRDMSTDPDNGGWSCSDASGAGTCSVAQLQARFKLAGQTQDVQELSMDGSDETRRTIIAALHKGGVAMRFDVYASFVDTFSDGPAASMYEHTAASQEKLGGHAVTIVGYGQVPAPDGRHYWIVENSWGSGWGSAGVFYLKDVDHVAIHAVALVLVSTVCSSTDSRFKLDSYTGAAEAACDSVTLARASDSEVAGLGTYSRRQAQVNGRPSYDFDGNTASTSNKRYLWFYDTWAWVVTSNEPGLVSPNFIFYVSSTATRVEAITGTWNAFKHGWQPTPIISYCTGDTPPTCEKDAPQRDNAGDLPNDNTETAAGDDDSGDGDAGGDGDGDAAGGDSDGGDGNLDGDSDGGHGNLDGDSNGGDGNLDGDSNGGDGNLDGDPQTFAGVRAFTLPRQYNLLASGAGVSTAPVRSNFTIAGELNEVDASSITAFKIGAIVAAHVGTKICDVILELRKTNSSGAVRNGGSSSSGSSSTSVSLEECSGRAVVQRVVSASRQVVNGVGYRVTVDLAVVPARVNGTTSGGVAVARVEASVFKKPLPSCAQFRRPHDVFEGGDAGCWDAQKNLNSVHPRVVLHSVQSSGRAEEDASIDLTNLDTSTMNAVVLLVTGGLSILASLLCVGCGCRYQAKMNREADADVLSHNMASETGQADDFETEMTLTDALDTVLAVTLRTDMSGK